MTVRWKVACINWSGHPDAPRALSYLWDGTEAWSAHYSATWAQAMARVNRYNTNHRDGIQ